MPQPLWCCMQYHAIMVRVISIRYHNIAFHAASKSVKMTRIWTIKRRGILPPRVDVCQFIGQMKIESAPQDDAPGWKWKQSFLYEVLIIIVRRNYPPNTGDVTVLLVQLIQFSSPPESHNLGLYALSGKTSDRQISWSLEAARFGFRLLHSPWNLTGTSAAALQISERCDNSNIQSRGFETSRDLVVKGLSE